MSADTKISLKPDKFDGSNWVFWKQRMKSMFVLDGIWDIVTGTTEKPDANMHQHLLWEI